MRTEIKILITIFICVFQFIQASGQEDTLKIPSNNNVFSIDGKYRDRKYAIYLDGKGRIMNADRGMIIYGFGPGIEYKLFNNHSICADLNFMIADDLSHLKGYYVTRARIEFETGYRYYHNLRKRMSKGLTGNNFSANYLILSPYFWLQYQPYFMERYYWDFENGTWALVYTSSIKMNPGIRLGYGLQRNFWKNVNFDINGGIQFQRVTYSPKLTELFFCQFSIGIIIK